MILFSYCSDQAPSKTTAVDVAALNTPATEAENNQEGGLRPFGILAALRRTTTTTTTTPAAGMTTTTTTTTTMKPM